VFRLIAVGVRSTNVCKRPGHRANLIFETQANRRAIGIAALLVTLLCWGITPVLLRRLTDFIDAWTANGVRYPIAAVLYWPVLVMAYRAGRLDTRLLRNCVWPATFALGGQVFWALAHYELSASETGFYVQLSMVWTIIGSMVIFRDERRLLRKPFFFVGIGLIAIGFLVMSWPGAESSVVANAVVKGGNTRLGLLYIVLCGALFGFYMVSVRRCIPYADPLLAFGIVANLVSIGTIAGMFIYGDVASIANQTAFSSLMLIGSSVIGVAVGHIMLYAAIQRLGAAITSSCQTITPFITATVAAVLLRESFSGRQWTGGVVMVLGAIVLLSLKHVIGEKSEKQVLAQSDGEFEPSAE